MVSGSTYTASYVGNGSPISGSVNSSSGSFSLSIPSSAVATSGVLEIIDQTSTIVAIVAVAGSSLGSGATDNVGTVSIGPPSLPPLIRKRH